MEIKQGDPEGSTETSGKAIRKDAEAISKDPTPKEGAPSSQDAFPDPDEDDLDDLDGQTSIFYLLLIPAPSLYVFGFDHD
jgi:hypothetical protein